MTYQFTSAQINEMARKARAYDDFVAAGLLSDFSFTLATAIEDELQHLREPVFTNPRSGRSASSLFAIVRAMGGDIPKSGWADHDDPGGQGGVRAVCRRVDHRTKKEAARRLPPIFLTEPANEFNLTVAALRNSTLSGKPSFDL